MPAAAHDDDNDNDDDNDDGLFTVGVEEEFLVVDPDTRRLQRAADRILPLAREMVGDQVESELHLSQVETGTRVCSTLPELRTELARLRGALVAAAERAGSQIAATGTHPFSHWSEDEVTPKPTYVGLERDYQQLAREQVICGCHVHIGIPGDEAVVRVLNQVRPWLATLLALGANSPFWLGHDTGYASFRTEVWRRWPTAGTPEAFRDRAEYDSLVDDLVATGSVDDPARIYWDIRPSARFSTLELRVTDVCLSIDETVMVAGLARALARVGHERAATGEPPPTPRSELLKAATWRAARYGLGADLVDIAARRARPAAEVVDGFLRQVRPALEASGDREEVEALVARTVERGTGADRQRRAYGRAGRMEDVVDLVVEETAQGACAPATTRTAG